MAVRGMHRVSGAMVFAFWAAVIAAPLVSHFAIVTGRLTHVAMGLAVLQAGALAVMAWRSGRGLTRWLGLAMAGVLLILLATRVGWAEMPAALTILGASGVSHAIIYASLLLLFARTLQAGRRDFVTSMALRLEGPLTPAMLQYTRGVTKAWCCFFAGELVVSGVLLTLTPHWVWSLFINVLDVPLVVSMFAAEYAVRRWRFRNVAHTSPITIFRNFASGGAGIDPG